MGQTTTKRYGIHLICIMFLNKITVRVCDYAATTEM